MVNAAIISLGSTSSQWTYEAMKNYFDEVDNLQLKDMEISFSGDKSEVLYRGETIKRYDCIFAKGSFRYAQLLESLTAVLERGCYMPIRSTGFTVGHDKLLTQLSLHQAGVPMPTTYQVSTIEAAKNLMEKLNFPLILKFPNGTGGKGVLYADSVVVANGILDALSALRQPFLIQEFIDTGGRDVRAIVVGDKVVAAYQRVASKKEIRSNIHSGGHGEPISLDAHTKQLCVKAARAVGADMAGVDLMISHRGPVFLEVNLSPGLQGVVSTTKIDVPDKIAEFLFTQTKARNEEIGKEKSQQIFQELEENSEHEMITALEFKGNKIMIPQLITKLTQFNEHADYRFKAKKEYLEISRFDVK